MARLYRMVGAALIVLGEAIAVTAGTKIDVTCTAESQKLLLPDWLCPLLVERMRLAYPEAMVRTVAGDAQADVTLHVLPGSGFSARLNWAGMGEGEPIAAVLMGRRMGPAEVGPVLDALIGQTPRPDVKP